MTLDDLERPFRILFQNTGVFGADHQKVNEDRSIQRQRCSAVTVVSGNIRFKRIFAGGGGSLETRRQTTVK